MAYMKMLSLAILASPQRGLSDDSSGSPKIEPNYRASKVRLGRVEKTS